MQNNLSEDFNQQLRDAERENETQKPVLEPLDPSDSIPILSYHQSLYAPSGFSEFLQHPGSFGFGLIKELEKSFSIPKVNKKEKEFLIDKNSFINERLDGLQKLKSNDSKSSNDFFEFKSCINDDSSKPRLTSQNISKPIIQENQSKESNIGCINNQKKQKDQMEDKKKDFGIFTFDFLPNSVAVSKNLTPKNNKETTNGVPIIEEKNPTHQNKEDENLDNVVNYSMISLNQTNKYLSLIGKSEFPSLRMTGSNRGSIGISEKPTPVNQQQEPKEKPNKAKQKVSLENLKIILISFFSNNPIKNIGKLSEFEYKLLSNFLVRKFGKEFSGETLKKLSLDELRELLEKTFKTEFKPKRVEENYKFVFKRCFKYMMDEFFEKNKLSLSFASERLFYEHHFQIIADELEITIDQFYLPNGTADKDNEKPKTYKRTYFDTLLKHPKFVEELKNSMETKIRNDHKSSLLDRVEVMVNKWSRLLNKTKNLDQALQYICDELCCNKKAKFPWSMMELERAIEESRKTLER